MAKLSRRRTIEKELNGDTSPLTRTLSIDSISSLFKRKRKRDTSESINGEKDETSKKSITQGAVDNKLDLEEKEQQLKKRKIKSRKEEEEFEANEKKLDEELPEELRKFRPRGYKFNIPPKDKPIRIYADGVFDLFHLGHMKQLEQAKKSFDNVQLVCGIPSDVETHKRKGLTVLTDEQRCETLMHCKWVDEVIPNAPWCVTPEFLKEHNIDYVAHDDLPYASSDSDDIYKPIKEEGKFLTTQRTDGISTSDIITKIIRDYDKYLMRNFARGATRKELNVSWLKKNELEFKKHINDFRTYWMRNKINLNNVSRDLYFEIREFMRGKKFDVQQYLENQNQKLINIGINGNNNSSSNSSINSSFSDDEDTLSSRSPLAEFAAKYVGNANKELNNAGKAIFQWIHKNDDDSFDEDEDTEIKPIEIKPSKRSRRRSSSNGSAGILKSATPVKSIKPLNDTITPSKSPAIKKTPKKKTGIPK